MWAFKQLWDKGLSTRATGSCPTAGSARPRCRTSRPARTTPTATARTRPSRSSSRSTPTTVRRPGRGAGALRVLAWTTTPWTLPSNLALAVGPDIEYAVYERGRAPPSSPGARRGLSTTSLPSAEPVATMTGAELVGRTYRAPVPLLRRPDRRLPRARRRLRGHRRGHRRRPHGAGLRRGRPAASARRPASRVVCPVDDRARSPPRCPDYAGPAGLRRQPPIIRRPAAAGALVTPRPTSTATRTAGAPTRPSSTRR